MKKLFLIIGLLLGAVYAQDTLLYEQYTYKEVTIPSSALLDVGNNQFEILPALTNSFQYYDIFKMILEFNAGSENYVWKDDYLCFSLNNEVACVQPMFITRGAYGHTTAVINSFNGKVDVEYTIDYHGFEDMFMEQRFIMLSYLDTSPTDGNGWILCKLWYRIRTVGSTSN